MNNLDYGVIGNCRSAALISKTGWIEWCCLPDFDSPSIFSKILDKNIGGEFGFKVSADYTITQKYVENTNILVTKYFAKEGAFEVFDFMPRYKTNESSPFVPSEIYRYVRYLYGRPTFTVIYNPKQNYAQNTVEHKIFDDYIRTESIEDKETLHLYSDFSLFDITEQKEIAITDSHYMLLSYNQKLISIDLERVYLEYTRTKTYWINWLNRANKYGLYDPEIDRSLLVLKLLTYQNSGALLAAITTSLPETIGETRNWDYRFCWLRDASMSVDTLLNLGQQDSAQKFMGFIKRILRSKSDTLQIMYGIRGERDLHEKELSHLSGYEDSSPVRIGNAAYYQVQNDTYGYLMNVIYRYYRTFPGTLDEIEDIWSVVRNVVRTVINNWKKPDKGIWEIRNEGKHFVFSKVMCWVALDRAVKIAKMIRKKQYEDEWSVIADEIKDDVFKNGWNDEIKSFTQTYDNTSMDASLLLMEEYGFIAPDDERFVQTVHLVKKELFHEGLMYRYINEDDFGTPSSAFTICAFWLVRAMYQVGDKEEAKLIFDNILSCSNHVGLFSEDIDFSTKRLMGNFPQAYSHLALINTAILFSKRMPIVRFIKP